MDETVKNNKKDVKPILIKSLIFLIFGINLLFFIQEIFIPDESRKRENADRTIDGLGQIEPGTVDVLFIGTSLIEYGISPMRLYEKTGICSYSLATSGQPIGVEYWLLKDAFTKQNPSVVVLLASSLFQVCTEDMITARWWHILDNYRLGRFKIDMAWDYSTLPYSDGYIATLFPIAKYHNRWHELTKSDFDLNYGGEYYALGEWINGIVSGNIHTTIESLNKLNNFLKQDSYITEYYENETYSKTISGPFVDPQVSDYNLQCLLNIKRLCDENGAKLLLTAIPYNYPAAGSGWTKDKANMIREISQTYDIPFYDLQYNADVGIDWALDSCDAGVHLNIRGAEKVSDILGQYFLDNYSLRQQNNPQYNAYREQYEKVRNVAMLQSEISFADYIQRIKDNASRWIVFIAASDEYTGGMDDESYNLLEGFGLRLVRQGAFRDAYIAILDRGEPVYEAVSGRKIYYSEKLNDLSVSVESSGWNTVPSCSIKLNGEEHSCSSRGLNIVVYDYDTHMVVDSVAFDTSVPSKSFVRNWSIVNNYLHTYESKVCFGVIDI